MKQSAYGTPLLIQDNKVTLLNKINTISELRIQKLVFQYPTCLPISDIDESYNPIIPICIELNTPVGSLDIFMISPSGDIIIVETKLWRNPEARRVVVAQILDYAKELSKWSYDDLQREVNRRLKKSGNSLYEMTKTVDSNLILEESDFVDAVSRNLKRGKFLLLIVGDGIREGAAGIAEFLVSSGNLNFTFAMVELIIYENIKNEIIMLPRIIAKTVELQKITVEIPEGLILTSSIDSQYDTPTISPEWEKERSFYKDFWEELLKELSFDDPGQPLPSPAKAHNLFVYPSKTRKAWISAYFAKSMKRVGVYFRCKNDSEGLRIHQLLSAYKDKIKNDLGEGVAWSWDKTNGPGVFLECEDIFDSKNRDLIKKYFIEWLNIFTNAIRPLMKDF